MRLGDWFRRLFSPRDDEAAEHDEYGLPDPGEAGVEHDRLSSFADYEAAEAAEAEIDSLKAPRDPAP